MFKTIEWTEQGVRIINQTRLPAEDVDCRLRVVHDSYRLEVALLVWGNASAWFFFNDRVKLIAHRIFEAGHSGKLTKAAFVLFWAAG